MPFAEFRALTFDCYGTLIDWESGILAELRPWAARHKLALSDEALLEGLAEEESRCQTETPAALYPAILAEVHRRLARRWSVAPSDSAAASFGQSVGRWPAFSDSAEALAYLKRHHKLIIVSNVDRASFAKSSEKLGVAFDLVVTAEDVGSYKPALGHFHRALGELAKLGIGKEQVLHVAQSLFHDIAPARGLGLKSVWINRRKGKPGGGATPAASARPDREFASMAEFAAAHRAEAR
jgi:2-haloalkanoic acid dehalogenase type II